MEVLILGDEHELLGGLAVVAQHSGEVKMVVADGDVSYVAVGSRIEVYDVADVADPSHPVLLRSSAPLPALVETLALSR